MISELDWLKKWNLYAPQSIAIIDGDTDRQFTYSELYQISQKGAQVLAQKFAVTR